MISVNNVARAAVVALAATLLAAGAVLADNHAPWPTDWNNWNDPALWVTVGNAGNDGEWAGQSYGGSGSDGIVGAVGYTFNMGKFEVTAGQYTAFLNAVAATDTYGLYNPLMWESLYGCKIERTYTGSGYTYSVAWGLAKRPVNFVSWGDAARFANWLTNGQPTDMQNGDTTEDGSYYLNGATSDAALQAVVRKDPEQGGRYYIPTEDEWYKAAYHKNDGHTGNYFEYPTGADSLPSNDLADPDPGNNANFWSPPQQDYTIGSPDWRTYVGDFENSGSPYGTFDQGGNVWEWIETILDDSSDARGNRGGSFWHPGSNLHASGRYPHERPSNENQVLGFRICEVPEPATLVLLALGGAAMLRRRRA